MKKQIITTLFVLLFSVSIVLAQDNLITTINMDQDQLFDNNLLNKIAITPKGDRLITGAKGAVVWDPILGTKLVEYWGHGGSNWISSLDISKSGAMVISGAMDRTARIWNLETGEDILTLETAVDEEKAFELSGSVAVTGAVFHDSGNIVITANNTGVIQEWNAVSGEEISRYEDMGFIQSIHLIPNRDILIVEKLSSFYLFFLKTGERTGFMRGGNIAVSKSGNRMVFTRDGKLFVNILNGNNLLTEKAFELEAFQTVKNVAIDPSGQDVLIGKVGNFNQFRQENVLFDREGIVVDNDVKQVRLPKQANPQFNTREEFAAFNLTYNDNGIAYFPSGNQYATINGPSVLIWAVNR